MRVLIAAAILYFAIAAYGHYNKPVEPEYVCPCNECDCGSLDELLAALRQEESNGK